MCHPATLENIHDTAARLYKVTVTKLHRRTKKTDILAALQITSYLTQTSADKIIHTLSLTQHLTLFLPDRMFTIIAPWVDFKNVYLALNSIK